MLKSKKIVSAILAATMVASVSTTAMASEGTTSVATEGTNVFAADNAVSSIENVEWNSAEGVTPYSFNRLYVKSIKEDVFTEIMYDSNDHAGDDVVTINLISCSMPVDIQFRLTEILPNGGYNETYETLHNGNTVSINVGGGNSFRLAAKGYNCSITTRVILDTD